MSQSISLSNMIKVTRIYFINDKQLLSNSRGHQSVMSTWKITLLTILQRNAICYINFTLHYYIYINETYNSCFCIQGIYIYIFIYFCSRLIGCPMNTLKLDAKCVLQINHLKPTFAYHM